MSGEDDYVLYGVDIDSMEDYCFEQETVVQRCKCGYEGPLVPACDGFECPDCGYLLIETND